MDSGTSHSSLAALLGRDVKRAFVLALCGCAGLAAFEWLAALIATPAPDVRVVTALRLLLIHMTLGLLLWVAVGLLMAGAEVASRLGFALWQAARTAPPAGTQWPGLFVRRPAGDVPGAAAAWLWASLIGVLGYVGASSYLTYRLITYFKEPQLTSFLLSLIQLVLVASIAVVVFVLALLLHRLGLRLHSRLARLRGLNPLGRVPVALLVMAVLGGAALKLAFLVMPQLAPLFPWRHVLAAAVFCTGVYAGMTVLARHGRILPLAGKQRRIAIGAGASAAVVLSAITLLRVGADHEAKSVAMTGSPLMLSLMDGIRSVTDIDRDGYGFLLGENDCAPLRRDVHPLARDIPDNGIDEDCNGRDFSFKIPPSYRSGERLPVPKEYLRDWNVLLITVDTVRYDHTGFGGYIETKKRDTTPNLDDLVERSISFDFANAPSAGTMASVPAILTSKFFHSGIALDEKVKPRMPPRLRPENVLIAELLDQHGYETGAILTHPYFEDWGMQQGFDRYDNDLGRHHKPQDSSAPEVTDRAIAWISANSRKKWFLWTHYIDPHGHYVEHPGEVSFGTTEEDRYDGELYFADKHIGRLLRELTRIPGGDRTIIIITSDHGDGFNEHGFINHGQALYRELLHVPLIVYIPEVPPRRIPGATSPLDIVPTVCDLVGIDTSNLSFEGESLVPQIFYGKDAHHRVVFAETNFPRPLRAAITSTYKLIYNLESNTYEFYDLAKDAWEKRNIYPDVLRAEAQKDPRRAGLDQMKGYLNDWLERVYYARDALTNQAVSKLKEYLLDQAPVPPMPTPGVTFDSGRIEILGIELDKAAYKTGDNARIYVYFRVKERPSGDFYLQAVLAGRQGEAVLDKKAEMRSKLRLTGNGTFPTSRWREGEYVRDSFSIRIPTTWPAAVDSMAVGLRITGADRNAPMPTTGTEIAGVPGVTLLGSVPLSKGTDAPAPAPPPGPGKGPVPGKQPVPEKGLAPGRIEQPAPR